MDKSEVITGLYIKLELGGSCQASWCNNRLINELFAESQFFKRKEIISTFSYLMMTIDHQFNKLIKAGKLEMEDLVWTLNRRVENRTTPPSIHLCFVDKSSQNV